MKICVNIKSVNINSSIGNNPYNLKKINFLFQHKAFVSICSNVNKQRWYKWKKEIIFYIVKNCSHKNCGNKTFMKHINYIVAVYKKLFDTIAPEKFYKVVFKSFSFHV